jgi:tetratricopeptide (TPR) repeat protein
VQWFLGAIALVCVLATTAYAGTRVWVGAAEPGAAQAERTAAAARLWRADGFLAFWEARQWWQASDGASAIAATERAVYLEPDSAFLWTDRGRVLAIFAPEDPEVLVAYERAEELFPASVEVPLHRGRHLLERGDIDGAAADVERALVLAPNDPDVQQLAIDVELAR